MIIHVFSTRATLAQVWQFTCDLKLLLLFFRRTAKFLSLDGNFCIFLSCTSSLSVLIMRRYISAHSSCFNDRHMFCMWHVCSPSTRDWQWVMTMAMGSEFTRDSDLTIKAVIFSFWSTIVYKFIYDEKRNSSDKLSPTLIVMAQLSDNACITGRLFVFIVYLFVMLVNLMIESIMDYYCVAMFILDCL